MEEIYEEDPVEGETSPLAGQRIRDLQMPRGSLLISVMRGGRGLVPTGDTVLEAGDEVMAVLEAEVEAELTSFLGVDGGVDGGSPPSGSVPGDG